jgi:hypothetical protein
VLLVNDFFLTKVKAGPLPLECLSEQTIPMQQQQSRARRITQVIAIVLAY